jgi:hypothetical protein
MKPSKSLERLAGAYIAAVYSHPAFPALKAREAGCLLAWGRLLLDSRRTLVPADELREHVAYFAQVGESEFRLMLTGLGALRLVAVDADDFVELLLLTTAVKRMSTESDRRKGGWEKRRNVATTDSTGMPATRISAPSLAPVKTRSAPIPNSQASLLDLEPSLLDTNPLDSAPAPTKRAAPATSSQSTDPVRIGASASDESHVVMRLECKGDRFAEFTEAFAASMKPLHPGVDVHVEMLRAAEWCRGKPERRKTLKGARSFITSWLARSSQRHDVTRAVVASSNQRNGFGQGGSHAPMASSSPQPNDSLHDFDDLADFEGLLDPAANRSIETVTPWARR